MGRDNFGLNMYDFGARFYDPSSARWTTIDPLAENYFSTSPYAYAANNPVRFVDRFGMAVDGWEYDRYGAYINAGEVVVAGRRLQMPTFGAWSNESIYLRKFGMGSDFQAIPMYGEADKIRKPAGTGMGVVDKKTTHEKIEKVNNIVGNALGPMDMAELGAGGKIKWINNTGKYTKTIGWTTVLVGGYLTYDDIRKGNPWEGHALDTALGAIPYGLSISLIIDGVRYARENIVDPFLINAERVMINRMTYPFW